EWFDSEMIASQKQLRGSASQVADCEGKHATEPVQAIFEVVGAIFFLEMNNGFCVRVRAKTMPFAFEFTAQIGEVVDLAVVGNPHRSIFVRHGHVPIGGEVENGKAAASQSDVSPVGETPLPQPGVVGSAVRLHVRHTDQRLPVAAVDESADATHDLSSSPSLVRTSARRFSLWSGTSAPLERRSRSAPARHREIPGGKHSDTGRAEPENPACDKDFA